MEDNVNLWQNLQAFSFWSVGDGKGIDVWYDAWIEPGLWIGDLDVTILIPNVIIHAKVADLVTHDGSWKWIVKWRSEFDSTKVYKDTKRWSCIVGYYVTSK